MRIIFTILLLSLFTTLSCNGQEDQRLLHSRMETGDANLKEEKIAFAAHDEYSVEIRTAQKAIFVKEPLLVQFVYENLSAEKNMRVHQFVPGRLVVEKEGQRQKLLLFKTQQEQTSDIAIAPITLKPGEKRIQPCFPLLLTMDENGHNANFLFETPGEYQLIFPELKGDHRFSVTVKEPLADGEVKAMKLLDLPMAKVISGETFNGDKAQAARESMDAFLKQCPGSYLSGYVSLALADHVWRLNSDPQSIDEKKYVKILQSALAMKPGHFLREAALFRSARIAIYQEGGRKRAIQIMDRIAQEQPESIYLRMLKFAGEESAVDIAKRVIADQSSAYTPGEPPVISYVPPPAARTPEEIQLADAAKKSHDAIYSYMLSDAVPEKTRIAYAITVLAGKRAIVEQASDKMSLMMFGSVDVRKNEGYLKDGLILAARFAQIEKAEQDGAGQPATALESKSESKQEPEPESEVRPQ